jgi:hypothetical protein
VIGGAEPFRRKLCDLFYKLAWHFDGETGSTLWLSSPNRDIASEDVKRVAVVEPEDVDLL